MKQSVSVSISADVSIFDCPAKLLIGSDNGKTMFCGTLYWGKKRTEDLLPLAQCRFDETAKELISVLLPKNLPGDFFLLYKENKIEISVQDENCLFEIAKQEDTSAVLFAFQISDVADTDQVFLRLLRSASDFFGIQQFILYAQSGKTMIFEKMLPADCKVTLLPDGVGNVRLLAYTRLDFQRDSLFCKAMQKLFGLDEADLFVVMMPDETRCMVKLPEVKTDFFKSKNLYLEIRQGKTVSVQVQGSFVFSFVPNMEFLVDCGVSNAAFMLEAFAHTETPLPLLGPFALGDTCLTIKVSDSLELGMYTSLYIRNLQLFGAVMLQIRGSTVTPQLISAAVSDISIPILLDNLLGRHISGIEAMDFIRIMGLPFQNMEAYDRQLLENRDVVGIVRRFNAQTDSPALRLDETQVQLTQFGDGVDLTDLKRMRHYYISNSGKLQLAAQFYYASVKTTIGNYQVEPGLFICGAIEIFGKRFEALFSYRENEGMLAYARIPSMDLGFLKLGPSQVGNQSDKMLLLSGGNIISQFISLDQSGITFFLSAMEKDISFFMDGRVEILSLFAADARIIFCSGLVSVDFRLLWLGILQISLHLRVAYNDFSSGGFEFNLMVDTSGLAEKMTGVTKKIDAAIKKLRNKIDDARKEIDRAQAHVNELYGQIDFFNRKIEQCKNEIHHAKWWKRAFVAIAKGIQIGAYEVAKVGIYAAIGVATAALEVAKGFLTLSGKVGEGVMKAVNGLIKGAMKLFFINYIKLDVKANLNAQYFQATIEFVALGKTYRLNKAIGIQSMKNSPSDALAGEIGGAMENDLNHIEDGAFRSNWRKYRHEEYTVEQQCRCLDEAQLYMDSSISLMQGMQNLYVREFGVPMGEFDEMNTSLMEALDSAQNVFSTGANAGDISLLAQSVGGLKRSVRAKEKRGVFRDEELKEAKRLIAQYEEARLFYDKVASGMKQIERKRNSMMKYQEKLHMKYSVAAGNTAIHENTGDVAKVLEQLETQLYETFPVDRNGKHFINLSREPLLQEIFQKADLECDRIPNPELQRMRNRSRKGSYESRL